MGGSNQTTCFVTLHTWARCARPAFGRAACLGPTVERMWPGCIGHACPNDTGHFSSSGAVVTHDVAGHLVGSIIEGSPYLGGRGLQGTSCVETFSIFSSQALPKPHLPPHTYLLFTSLFLSFSPSSLSHSFSFILFSLVPFTTLGSHCILGGKVQSTAAGIVCKGTGAHMVRAKSGGGDGEQGSPQQLSGI